MKSGGQNPWDAARQLPLPLGQVPQAPKMNTAEAQRASNRAAAGPAAEAYLPYWSGAMQDSYRNYMEGLGDQNELPDLTKLFTESGGVAYDPYRFTNANEWYEKYSQGPYQQYDYTFGDEYGPIDSTAFQYTAPEIEQVQDIAAPEFEQVQGISAPTFEEVQDISGVPADVWKQISDIEEGAVRQGYKGQRAELARRLAAGGSRAGLAASKQLQLASDEEAAVQKARQQAALQRALQEVGVAQQTQSLAAQRGLTKGTTEADIAKGTQALQAQRGLVAGQTAADIAKQTQALQASRATEQAGMLSRTEELQAQELARKQGIDIEDARYRISLKKEREQLAQAEGKYAFESGEEQAKYKTGLNVAAEEAEAAEAEKAYKSKYGLAQDVTGLALTQHQQEEQDKAAANQAALSGGQLAQGGFAQTGSYDIQKEPKKDDQYYAGTAAASNQGATNYPALNFSSENARAAAAKEAANKTTV